MTEFTSDEGFAALIGGIVAQEGDSSALADALLVSVDTVKRWGHGKNLPLPEMRQGIVDRLMQLALTQ